MPYAAGRPQRESARKNPCFASPASVLLCNPTTAATEVPHLVVAFAIIVKVVTCRRHCYRPFCLSACPECPVAIRARQLGQYSFTTALTPSSSLSSTPIPPKAPPRPAYGSCSPPSGDTADVGDLSSSISPSRSLLLPIPIVLYADIEAEVSIRLGGSGGRSPLEFVDMDSSWLSLCCRDVDGCGIGAGFAAFIDDRAAALRACESCRRFGFVFRMNCRKYVSHAEPRLQERRTVSGI